MDKQKLQALDSRVLYREFGCVAGGAELIEGNRERFERFYAGMRDDGATEYDLDRIATAVFFMRGFLSRKNLTGKNLTAVEVGSGSGSKSLSFCGLFGTYIGIEIDVKQVGAAEAKNVKYGSNNIRFIAGNAADILSNQVSYGIPEKIDLLILYAVVEHLTLDERRIVIGLADKVTAAGGAVLIMESPNRLIPFDGHTAGMHFFNWLPDEIANYLARSSAAREEIRVGLKDWKDPDAAELLARAGRGVCFHDFSAMLGNPIDEYMFEADGYDVEMLNMEPLNFQQTSLYGYLLANTPHIPAAVFSRSWLDFVFSKRAMVQPQKRFFSPFWPKWMEYETPPVFWDPAAIILGGARPTWICEFESSFIRDLTIIFSAPSNTGRLFLRVNGQSIDEVDVTQLVRAKPSTWHNSHAVSISLNCVVHEISIESDSRFPGVLFQGCMASTV